MFRGHIFRAIALARIRQRFGIPDKDGFLLRPRERNVEAASLGGQTADPREGVGVH